MSHETNVNLTSKIEPRMWQCGEAIENEIPTDPLAKEGADTPEKNHWKILLDSYLEDDKTQCELWKDEVNILLIFAGLFSAVVTAFLIDSYKLLKEDPAAQTLAAFNRLGDRLDNLALHISGAPPIVSGTLSPVVEATSFSPSAHDIRLNSLWFSSLVLSLTTVVLGLVALQWLRNHQRYHGIKPREALSVYRMRTKALRSWHIRWVFMSLPLLLLVALVLFFVGLVDFLLSLNDTVAVPIGILVYSTLFILFTTSVLPTLQILKLSYFTPSLKSEDDIPTQCPYKSPQSWIFHRFVTLFITAVRYIMRRDASKGAELRLSNIPLYFAFYASPTKWTDYDTKWIRMRDLYSQKVEGKFKVPLPSISAEHPRRPIYDEAQILMKTVSDMPSPEVLYASYHCFREVSENALYQEIELREDYAEPKFDQRNAILRGYYWKHLNLPTTKGKGSDYRVSISSLVPDPDPKLLHDENMMVFLQMHSAHNLPEKASRVVGAHLAELQSRILAYTFARPREIRKRKVVDSAISATNTQTDTLSTRATIILGPAGNQWSRMMSRQYIDMIVSSDTSPKFKIWSCFAIGSLNGNNVPVAPSVIERTIEQYSMIFDSFVHQAASATFENSNLPTTTFTHRSVSYFLEVPAYMYRYYGTSSSPFDTFSKFEASLQFIQNTLANAPTANDSDLKAFDSNDAFTQNTSAKPSTPEERKEVDKSKGADFLFLCACFFLDQLFNPQSSMPLKPFDEAKCVFMGKFIAGVASYEQKVEPLSRIEQRFDLYWDSTGLPQRPRYKSRNGPDQLSYIHMSKFPSWILSSLPN